MLTSKPGIVYFYTDSLMTGTTVAHTDTKKIVICNWYNRVACLPISASFSMCEIGSQVCVCMTVYKAQVQVS